MTTEKKANREVEKRRLARREEFAKKLKKIQNKYEQVLWEKLKACQMGVNFRFQVPLADTPYVADFYCSQLKLNIEVDGGIHQTEERKVKDQRRDARLEALGIQVLRIPVRALHSARMMKTLYHIRNAIESRTIEMGGVVE